MSIQIDTSDASLQDCLLMALLFRRAAELVRDQRLRIYHLEAARIWAEAARRKTRH